MSWGDDAHSFLLQSAGYLILAGIACWALGDGVAPLVGGVSAILFLAAFIGRIRR